MWHDSAAPRGLGLGLADAITRIFNSNIQSAVHAIRRATERHRLAAERLPKPRHPVGPGEYSPCNFRRWKRGDPRKLFLMELSRVLHGIPPMLGLDGGVGLGVPAGLSFGVWTGVPLGVGRGLPLGEG